MRNFELVYMAGETKEDGKFWVEISYKDGKLSLSGVAGAKSNGDCLGSCGQCQEYLLEIKTQEAKRLFEIWNKWHLNDMRPNCEHQVGSDWNTQKEITLYHYKQTSDFLLKRNRLKSEKEKELLTNLTASITKEEAILLNAPYFLTTESDIAQDGYILDKKEVKTAGWVNHKEHKHGLLGKPCLICGYEYGTAWRKEEVPLDVLEFLRGLKDSKSQYPWKS